MIYAGESARFILRRLIILASEDVGMADPTGLLIATAAAQAFEYIGMPEGVYPIVEATLYLCTAPKSNSAKSYFEAYTLVESEGQIDVPNHLKDVNRDGEALGHGTEYIYPHNEAGHHIGQQYMPNGLLGRYFYQPSDQGYEKEVDKRLQRWRLAQKAVLGMDSKQYESPPRESD